jgi:hypothetical protein
MTLEQSDLNLKLYDIQLIKFNLVLKTNKTSKDYKKLKDLHLAEYNLYQAGAKT